MSVPIMQQNVPQTNTSYYSNSTSNDVLFTTNQTNLYHPTRILLGTTSNINTPAALIINSNNVYVNDTLIVHNITTSNLNFTGQLQQNGFAYVGVGSQWTGNVGGPLTYYGGASVSACNFIASNFTASNICVTEGIFTDTTFTKQYIGSQWSNVVGGISIQSSNVGIGTSNPQFTLDVCGNSYFSSNLSASNISAYAISVSNLTVSNLNVIGIVTDQFTVSNLGTGPALKVHQLGASDIAEFWDDQIIAMKLNQGGKVSIGATSATEILDVYGNAKFNSNVYIMHNLGINNSNPSMALDVTGSIKCTGTVSACNFIASNFTASNICVTEGIFTDTTFTKQYIGSQWSNVVGGISIQSSNVGIGTSNPQFTLDVCGNSYFSSNLSASNISAYAISVSNLTVSNLNVIGIVTDQFTVSNLGTGPALKVHQLGASDIAEFWDDQIIAMKLNQGGKVSIGATSATEILDVYGNAKFNSNVYIMHNLGINNSNPSMALDVTGSIKCTGTMNAATVYSSGDVTAFSDCNYKTDLLLVTDACAKVNILHGYTFSRTDMEDKQRYVGLLAQEVESVLPEAVYTNENGKKSLAYGNLAALFVEAIKDLNQRITTLETKLL